MSKIGLLRIFLLQFNFLGYHAFQLDWSKFFQSLYKSAILNSKWQLYMQGGKGDNSILVGNGLKMQNSQTK